MIHIIIHAFGWEGFCTDCYIILGYTLPLHEAHGHILMHISSVGSVISVEIMLHRQGHVVAIHQH